MPVSAQYRDTKNLPPSQYSQFKNVNNYDCAKCKQMPYVGFMTRCSCNPMTSRTDYDKKMFEKWSK